MKRLLDVNGITKVFGGGTVNEKTALSGVNLIMNEGDFVTVIGNNGAGKSTLLNCIAGVFPVDAEALCWTAKTLQSSRSTSEHAASAGSFRTRSRERRSI